MRRLLVVLALGLALPALASEEGPKPRVVTTQGQSASCIAPIAINQVDGRIVNTRPMFDLEPGEHSLSGVASVPSAPGCSRVRGQSSRSIEPLKANFERGKTYHVGLDHSSHNQDDWTIVIWKVEDR